MEMLTKRQEEILDYIRAEIRQKATAPSLLEIGERFDIPNPNGIRTHILALERKGYIRRTPDKARSIQVVGPAPYRLSRLIASAKEKIWGKRRFFYFLPVYICLHTRKGHPFFTGKHAGKLEEKVRQTAANHEWEVLELAIAPDRMTIGLAITPDHSLERVVRNLKTCTLAMNLKHPIHFRGRKIWAAGFAASSNPWVLKELEAEHSKGLSDEPEGEEEATG